MITCTRRIEFDAAHRILNHESKCKMLHGHRYVLEAEFTAKKLDKLGRIIDFGVIREVLGTWIDDNNGELNYFKVSMHQLTAKYNYGWYNNGQQKRPFCNERSCCIFR